MELAPVVSQFTAKLLYKLIGYHVGGRLDEELKSKNVSTISPVCRVPWDKSTAGDIERGSGQFCKKEGK